MIENVFRGRSKILMIVLNVIGLAAAVLLILKVPYGFGSTDECYYIASPLKVIYGDAMMKDEWFVAQLFGFLLIPLIRLYLLIAGSTEGIILTFRYIYIILKIAATVFVYRRLKRKVSIFPAFWSALLFLLYSPYDIMALSYNSMGHICLCMSMAVFATMDINERASAVLAGFLYAVSVICCPYLIVLFILYTLLIIFTRRAKWRENVAALKTATWVRAFCGAAVLAVIFAVFLLARASFAELIASLPHILTNPSHEVHGIVSQVKDYIWTLVVWDRKRFILYALGAVICVLMLFSKIRMRFRWVAFILAAALTLCFTLLPGYPDDMSNHYILPLNLLGFICFFITEKKQHSLFWGMWVPGLIYSFALFMSSNQMFYVASSATIVAAPASIVFIADAVCDISDDIKPAAGRNGICALALALMVLQIAVVGYFAMEHCFWDKNRSELDTRMDTGCEKGLITTRESNDYYMSQREETAAVRNMTEGRVIYCTEYELWLPLDDTKQCGSCFSYYFGGDEYIGGELKEYYEMYPDKRPQYWFFEQKTDMSVMTELLGLDSSHIHETASGNYLVY